MSERVRFAGKDGAEIEGAEALPSGDGKAPGLVLVQEWWGLNAHVESLVDRFAKAGFVVLAPDLYRGEIAKAGDSARAQELMTNLDGARALGDIAGAVKRLASHPRCTGKIGITGFCMGGAYAIAAASHIPEIGASVPFYGIPPEQNVTYATLKAPIQMHVAKHDEWVTAAAAQAVRKQVEAHGGSIELHIYDAHHAFVNDTRPDVYSQANAEVALTRAIAFLHHHLG